MRSFSPLTLLGIGGSERPPLMSRQSEGGTAARAANAGRQDLDGLLEQFRTTEQPKTSRVDNRVKQVAVKPVPLLESWKYLYFVGSQATSAAGAFVSHHLYGPQKASWGIEMTLFTTFLRNSVNYSHLSSIGFLRKILNLGQVLPIPKDGIVTPISFRVKRRGLTGFLSESDSCEDGTRELTGEWVTNKKLWRRMQDGYKSDEGHEESREQVILYLHGGAYYVMSAASHRFLTIQVSKSTNSRVFAINYRLAPETRFPGALLDAANAYFRLIHDLRIPSQNVVIAGDSAGAGLCTALLLYLRDEGYPLPSGAILMSPWVDLTMSCASWDTNAKFDYLPQPSNSDHLHPVKCYLGPDDLEEFITHPYASPLFGDFHGIPPLLIQCGDAERLRDEGTLLAHKASLAGVHVDHEIYEDCVHVFQMFGFLEATRKSMKSIRKFVRHTVSIGKPMDPTKMDSQIMADAHAVRDEDAELEPQSLPPTPSMETTSLPSYDHHLDADEDGNDSQLNAALKASRSIIDAAITASHSLPGGSPELSPARMLRRLPSQTLVMSSASAAKSSRPRNHHRSMTTSLGRESLRVRPRSQSHPSLRALMEDMQRDSQYEAVEGDGDGDGETSADFSRPSSPP